MCRARIPNTPKAIATSKHFAVHSGPESLRHVFNVDVSPRNLEETYLPAFRSTVVDGHVKSVMCAYNAINNDAACASKLLLGDHLRGAWSFNGFVVSDCAAIVDVARGHHNAPDILHAAALSLRTGTDLSSSIWSPGFNTLADAVRQGAATEDLVTRSAERLYTARFQLGLFNPQGSGAFDKIPFSENASEPHRQIALKAAEESIVLLKNSGVLPLRNKPASIAVIGLTADLLTAIEGNYNGAALHSVSPLDGIARKFPGTAIHYAQGSTLDATFYASTSDLPPFTEYAMKNRTYRYYTGKPMWGFGYGLSYSDFRYGPARLSHNSVAAGQPVTATVAVTNTSKLPGDEVVEAYLKTRSRTVPPTALSAFNECTSKPGKHGT